MKKLILIRHAHRHKVPGIINNGLSNKGEKQARLVADYYSAFFKDQKSPLLSSPLKRCIETLEPLSKRLDTEIEIVQSLGEGSGLYERAEKFLRDWESLDLDLCIACSHGDWIPVFLERYAGLVTDIKKGGWAELEFLGRKQFKVVKLLQDLVED